MTPSQIIEDALEHFETKTRADGTSFYVLKDSAPEALHDSVRDAHGDRMPNDWHYEQYVSIIDALNGYTLESIDDIEENRPEIVDGLVDVYTSDLTEWLNQSPHNVYYITEAQEQLGASTDGFEILQRAQYMAIDEVYAEVQRYIETQIEEVE